MADDYAFPQAMVRGLGRAPEGVGAGGSGGAPVYAPGSGVPHVRMVPAPRPSPGPAPPGLPNTLVPAIPVGLTPAQAATIARAKALEAKARAAAVAGAAAPSIPTSVDVLWWQDHACACGRGDSWFYVTYPQQGSWGSNLLSRVNAAWPYAKKFNGYAYFTWIDPALGVVTTTLPQTSPANNNLALFRVHALSKGETNNGQKYQFPDGKNLEPGNLVIEACTTSYYTLTQNASGQWV